MLFKDRETFHRQLRTGLLAHTPKNVYIDGFHRAGVLVPLVWTGQVYELLFTKRTETVETHRGQISFPGGMVDSDDLNIVHTALREAREELGIHERTVSVEGTLDDLPTPSGFVITPVVGVIDALPTLHLNTREVAEAFHIPLAFFADPAAGRSEMREFRGSQREVWFYEHGTHVIWGATAMIVRSLLKSLGIV